MSEEWKSPEIGDGWLGKLLTFRGTFGQGKYFLGLIVEIGIMMVGLMSLAGLNNPTGGGSLFLAVIFPLMALYLHLCLVTARLRDAGSPKPVLAGIFIGFLPFVWIFALIEYIESLWLLILLIFAVLYFGPVFPKSKAVETAQS